MPRVSRYERIALKIERLSPVSSRDDLRDINLMIASVDSKFDSGPTPEYLLDYNAAFGLVPGGLMRDLSDIAADGLPMARLYDSEGLSVVGTGRDLLASLCAAAVRALEKLQQ